MSADLEDVIRDYVALIQKKDSDYMSLFERNQLLEQLLAECKVAMSQVQQQHQAEHATRLGLESQIDDLTSTVDSMDQELRRLRNFSTAVRRLLVLEQVHFTDADVIKVLVSRLEDCGTITRDFRLMEDAYWQLRDKSLAVMEDLECEHRRMLSSWSEELAQTHSLMQHTCQETIQRVQDDRDCRLEAAAGELEFARAEAQHVSQALTPQLSALRQNVDHLVEENRLLTSREEQVGQFVQSLRVEGSLLRAANELLVDEALSQRALAWQAVAESIGEWTTAWGTLLPQCLRDVEAVRSERDVVHHVNQSLRAQVADISKHSAAQRKQRAAEHKSALEANEKQLREQAEQISHLRQKYSDTVQHSHLVAEELRSVRAREQERESLLAQLIQEDTDRTSQQQRVEAQLQQKQKEVHHLKGLLSELRQKSAMVRDLITNQEEQSRFVEVERDALRQSLDQMREQHSSSQQQIVELQQEVKQMHEALDASRRATMQQRALANEDLESHLVELRAALVEEQSQSQQVKEQLDQATVERNHLERKLRELQQHYELESQVVQAMMVAATSPSTTQPLPPSRPASKRTEGGALYAPRMMVTEDHHSSRDDDDNDGHPPPPLPRPTQQQRREGAVKATAAIMDSSRSLPLGEKSVNASMVSSPSCASSINSGGAGTRTPITDIRLEALPSALMEHDSMFSALGPHSTSSHEQQDNVDSEGNAGRGASSQVHSLSTSHRSSAHPHPRHHHDRHSSLKFKSTTPRRMTSPSSSSSAKSNSNNTNKHSGVLDNSTLRREVALLKRACERSADKIAVLKEKLYLVGDQDLSDSSS